MAFTSKNSLLCLFPPFVVGQVEPGDCYIQGTSTSLRSIFEKKRGCRCRCNYNTESTKKKKKIKLLFLNHRTVFDEGAEAILQKSIMTMCKMLI